MLKQFFSGGKKAADYSILIVDDEPGINQLIASMLKDEGYICYSAANGDEALKLLDEVPLPNLFIVDVVMPQMNGKEFLDKARIRLGRSALPPVLMLTASKDGETVAHEAEVDDFLPKPFEGDTLLAHVSKLIEKYTQTPQ
ncbi:MAG: response regulator transcription factor [Anaerolineae bacterium]|nr:response regulator transcription factor [Anaerolineae bacterium]